MRKNLTLRLDAPLKTALLFAGLGIALTLAGVVRGSVPPNPLSILVAVALSGGAWGVVSWAIATAAVDSERDLDDTDE
jgi:hypothetical protein